MTSAMVCCSTSTMITNSELRCQGIAQHKFGRRHCRCAWSASGSLDARNHRLHNLSDDLWRQRVLLGCQVYSPLLDGLAVAEGTVLVNTGLPCSSGSDPEACAKPGGVE